MQLHKNPIEFTTLIKNIQKKMFLEPSYIEKDYYIFMYLKLLIQRNNNFVFKGGTSLSKCNKIINRFSEDIDLGIDNNVNLTVGTRKKIKKDIIDVSNELGLKLLNYEDIRSRRDFNRYKIDYSPKEQNAFLLSTIIIETSTITPTYPFIEMNIDSIIYEYLINNNQQDIISQYDLEPFKIKVQALERTFVDKVFAICDYYLSKIYYRNSRHIYDLYKIFDSIVIDDKLKTLIKEIRAFRMTNSKCYSAQSNININDILKSIINEQTFKEDYNNVLINLLYEDLSYETSIEVLNKIINLNIF